MPINRYNGVGYDALIPRRFNGVDNADLFARRYNGASYDIIHAPNNRDVWLFFGQSNTAAADAIIDLVTGIKTLAELGEQTAADQAALLCCAGSTDGSPNSNYSWGAINGYQGHHFGAATDGSGNPWIVGGDEVQFNRDLYAAGKTSNAYIKFYDNFTALESGHSAWYPGGSLYTAMNTWFDDQIAALEVMGYSTTIRGMIYHQGIDDGILHRSQSDYQTDITATFNALRIKYGATLPLVVIRSVNSTIAGTTYMAPIRAAQEDIGNNYPHCNWVSNDDLENVNTHHLTYASHLTLGDRVYDAMMTLLGW